MSARAISRPVAALILALSTWPAAAEPLTTVNLSSPAVRCVFSTSPHCNLDGTTTLGAIPVPGITGNAVVHSLTFPAFADSDARGTYGYEFRVDLSGASAGATKACVTRLTLDVGPIKKLPYMPGADPFDVFVINTGATGLIGVASAERAENAITFAFAKPVCPGAGPDKGESSYFFGFAADGKPREISARVELDDGQTLQVPARAPAP